jgi:hypothetical protein
MFNYCEKLESADYSYLDLQNITDMHYLVSASPFLKISISLILKLKNYKIYLVFFETVNL